MNEMWNKNVGSKGRPESYLHARAIAHLWDALHGDFTCSESFNNHGHPGPEKGVKARLNPGGSMSGNLLEGVTKVTIPDPEWDQVGGIVPDLALFGPEHDSKPVRIIEVVVYSPPDKAKRVKLDALVRRGVDVVEIRVSSERDLVDLCWEHSEPTFRVPQRRRRDRFRPVSNERSSVRTLIDDLRRCSAVERRELLDVLNCLDTVESLAPLSQDNPIKEKLQKRQTTTK